MCTCAGPGNRFFLSHCPKIITAFSAAKSSYTTNHCDIGFLARQCRTTYEKNTRIIVVYSLRISFCTERYRNNSRIPHPLSVLGRLLLVLPAHVVVQLAAFLQVFEFCHELPGRLINVFSMIVRIHNNQYSNEFHNQGAAYILTTTEVNLRSILQQWSLSVVIRNLA